MDVTEIRYENRKSCAAWPVPLPVPDPVPDGKRRIGNGKGHGSIQRGMLPPPFLCYAVDVVPVTRDHVKLIPTKRERDAAGSVCSLAGIRQASNLLGCSPKATGAGSTSRALPGSLRRGACVPNQIKESKAFPHPTATHLTIEARESTNRSALVPSGSSAPKASS